VTIVLNQEDIATSKISLTIVKATANIDSMYLSLNERHWNETTKRSSNYHLKLCGVTKHLHLAAVGDCLKAFNFRKDIITISYHYSISQST
jgi:hypothetical protein